MILLNLGGPMNVKDRKILSLGIGILILMLITAFIFGGSIAEGGGASEMDLQQLFGDAELRSETVNMDGNLNEGQQDSHEIDTVGKLVKNITARLSWQDETSPPAPRLRQHNNGPDTFSLEVISPDGNSSRAEGSNQIDNPGEIIVTISIEEEDLLTLMLGQMFGLGNLTVEVTMVDAGMWVPQVGPGMIGLRDDGNSYSLTVEIEFYEFPSEEEE